MIVWGRILVLCLAMTAALFGWSSPGNSFDRFQGVEAVLKQPGGPKSVAEFLSLAAKANPELFSHFSLMRKSQSLQDATPAAPRAIVYGKDARFILTFNGSPNQAGFNHIEMMQFVDTAGGGGKFELREIAFDPAKRKRPVISEINPAKCARCHGTDPKPLWEDYDRWPGAYGEDDDALIDFDDPSRYPTSLDGDNAIVARHRQHLKEFRSFMVNRVQHPRYKWLIIPEGAGSPVAPYIPSGRSGKSPLRPNLNLTALFSELNGKRVARKFADYGEACFAKGAPLAAALLLECDAVDSQRVLMKSITEQLLNDQRQYASSRPVALEPVIWSLRNPSFYNDGRVSLLEIMGFSYFDWTPARQKRQWQYFQGFKDTSDDILAALWPALQAKTGLVLPSYSMIRTELNPQYYQSIGGDYDDTGRVSKQSQTAREQACTSLGNRLQDFDVNTLRQSCQSADQGPASVPAAIAMCMSCHDGGSDAPALPLDDAMAVRANSNFLTLVFERLNAEDRDQRMPPTRPITADEYQQLVRFYQRDATVGSDNGWELNQTSND